MTIKLAKGERIIGAWCEDHRGPGWANWLVHYIVRTGSGAIEQRFLQPSERSEIVATWHDVSALLTRKLVNELEAHVEVANAEHEPRAVASRAPCSCSASSIGGEPC